MSEPLDKIASVRIIVRVLKCVGLWRVSPAWQPYYQLYGYVLHFLATIYFCYMMWVDLLHFTDMVRFYKTAYISFTQLALSAKVLNILRRNAVAHSFLEAVAKDNIFRLHNEQEQEIFVRNSRQFRYLCLAYFGATYISVSMEFLRPIFTREYRQYELPYAFEPPFDWRQPRTYWYAYVYEAIAMPISCTSNCALDTFTFYILLHSALWLKIIGMRLAKLGGITANCPQDSEPFTKLQERRFRNELVENARLYEAVRCIYKQCEFVVSLSLLAQILCSSFIVCFTVYGVQNVNILRNPSEFISIFLAFVIMTLQIFIPCYCGNEITRHSDSLTNAIYNADWTRCSTLLRKDVCLFMQLLTRPLKVFAGNFFFIDLPLFMLTMKNTYSLLAIILKMKD